MPSPDLTISRIYPVPRATVWAACSDASGLRHWWAQPEDAAMPVCDLDFRIGGRLHMAIKRPGKDAIWFLSTYTAIRDGEHFATVMHRSDKTGNICDNDLWPPSTMTVTLEDVPEGTRLTATQSGMLSARATLDDYRQGWTETLERLARHLASP